MLMQGSESEGIPFAVRLSFFELVNRAGFSSYQDKVYWEVWKIQLRLVTGSQNSTGATQAWHLPGALIVVHHSLHLVSVSLTE